MSLRYTEYGTVAKGYDYDLWLLAPYRRARLTPNLRATLSGSEPADVLTITRLYRAVGIARPGRDASPTGTKRPCSAYSNRV